MNFYPGFDIHPTIDPMGFKYGPEVFGPRVEYRTLDSIRQSLLQPQCEGPDPVYAIAMDVGKNCHKPILEKYHLLFGAVTYAAGHLGKEPVRSQGHIHKKARSNTLSPPEIYEIWSGTAIIYMQESGADFPGRCFAVFARPGEVVIVPPDWAHATISADPATPLSFGAWCDRDYGFEYSQVRAHHGLAWFPVLSDTGNSDWQQNPNYLPGQLIQKTPGDYSGLGIRRNIPIYTQFEENPELFLFVSNPIIAKEVWDGFIP